MERGKRKDNPRADRGQVWVVVYLPDTTKFATGGLELDGSLTGKPESSVQIWAAKTGKLVATLKGHRYISTTPSEYGIQSNGSPTSSFLCTRPSPLLLAARQHVSSPLIPPLPLQCPGYITILPSRLGLKLQGHRPAVIEVPYAKGKRRNASAREVVLAKQKQKAKLLHSENSTAGRSQPPQSNVVKPCLQPQAADPVVHHTCHRRCYHSYQYNFNALAP